MGWMAAATAVCAMVQGRHQREAEKRNTWSRRLRYVVNSGLATAVVAVVVVVVVVVVALGGGGFRQQVRQQQLLFNLQTKPG